MSCSHCTNPSLVVILNIAVLFGILIKLKTYKSWRGYKEHSVAKKIAGLSNMNYWERLASLKLMSLQRRRERYIIIQMWKLLHKITPNDVNFQFSHRPRLSWKAVVPSWEIHSRAANRNVYDNSFAVVGPQLWNTLPVALNTIQTRDTFKYRLSHFLSK